MRNTLVATVICQRAFSRQEGRTKSWALLSLLALLGCREISPSMADKSQKPREALSQITFGVLLAVYFVFPVLVLLLIYFWRSPMA